MTRCPVCKQECEEDAPYCTRCGWELSSRLVVGGVSEAEEQAYRARLKIAKKNWQRLSRLEDGAIASAQDGDVLSVLPAPFAWCEIPGKNNYRMLNEYDDLVGTFNVEPFQMAKYPVTNAQFQAFADAADGYGNDRWWRGLGGREKVSEDSRFSGMKRPRTNVSWYDAVAFCRWLSSRVGYEVRLPTEWEWQWAAQGPDGRRYPWGDVFDASKCNCRETGINETTPVDEFPLGASPYGVMDMSGNVLEWCLNEYDKPFSVAPGGKAVRSNRGGSWLSIVSSIRSAHRLVGYPEYPECFLGFRCARGTSP